MATKSTGRKRLENRIGSGAFSAPSESREPRISATTLLVYASPPIRASVRRAWSSAPLLICHRGLSGTKRADRKNTADGAATAVNIHRHAYWPFQERRIIS